LISSFESFRSGRAAVAAAMLSVPVDYILVD